MDNSSAVLADSFQESSIVTRSLPFTPHFKQYARSIRFDDIDDAQVEAQQIFDHAGKVLKPTFIIGEAFIDRFEGSGDNTTIEVNGITFTGKALGVLSSVHRIFPYVASCGNQLEDFDVSEFDFLAPYWLDMLKVQALGVARGELRKHCQQECGIQRPLSLNPGSGNVDIWPIEQMSNVFQLLGGEQAVYDHIGVRLTESSLMIPNKTIAGIMFASAEYDYESCAHCERERCPSRRVPFEKRL